MGAPPVGWVAHLIVSLSYDSMTKMTIAQGRTSEVLDSVVPRNISPLRMAIVTVLVMALACVAWIVRWEGAYAPNLLFGENTAGYGGSAGTHPELYSDLQSSKWFPVTITGIDATAPGLGDPRITFTSARGRAVRLPFRLQQGEDVIVHISWGELDCSAISLHERYYMPVHYTDAAGLSGTVDMVPLRWVTPAYDRFESPPPPDPSGLGWPAGVSWTACGRSARTAPDGRAVSTI
jgi:hypothetical protein